MSQLDGAIGGGCGGPQETFLPNGGKGACRRLPSRPRPVHQRRPVSLDDLENKCFVDLQLEQHFSEGTSSGSRAKLERRVCRPSNDDSALLSTRRHGGSCGRQILDKRALRRRKKDDFRAAIQEWRSQPSVSFAKTRRFNGGCHVSLRLRPIFDKEIQQGEFEVVTVREDSGEVVVHNCLFHADLVRMFVHNVGFSFPRVFGPMASNEDVYRDCGSTLVSHALGGQLGTIFMFGQTGSGKTYTMNCIIELAAREIFASSVNLMVNLRCFEVAGKKCFDLLARHRAELKLLEDQAGKTNLVGALEAPASSAEECLRLLFEAHGRRATAGHSRNEESSRSHFVCVLDLPNGGSLVLVDCAGTERRQDNDQHTSERMRESAEINASLHALKECIRQRGREYRVAAAATKNSSGDGSGHEDEEQRQVHVPYRDSPLTRVLQASFTRPGSYLAAIGTISPIALDTEHTLATLRTLQVLSEPGINIEGIPHWEQKCDVDPKAVLKRTALMRPVRRSPARGRSPQSSSVQVPAGPPLPPLREHASTALATLPGVSRLLPPTKTTAVAAASASTVRDSSAAGGGGATTAIAAASASTARDSSRNGASCGGSPSPVQRHQLEAHSPRCENATGSTQASCGSAHPTWAKTSMTTSANGIGAESIDFCSTACQPSVEVVLLPQAAGPSQTQPDQRSESGYIDVLRQQVGSLQARVAHLEQELDLKTSMASLAEAVSSSELRDALSRAETAERRVEELETKGRDLEQLFQAEQELRRKSHNQLLDLKGQIRVFCRIRPLLMPREQGEECVTVRKDAVSAEVSRVQISVDGLPRQEKRVVQFDAVFGPAAQQEEVFREVQDLVQSAVDGYNVSIMTYGQTGAGKTYTLYGGEGEHRGIAPRTVQALFERLGRLDSRRFRYTVRAHLVELYKTDLLDLLASCKGTAAASGSARLEVRRDVRTGDTTIDNVDEREVASPEELLRLLEEGTEHRHVASTQLNADSSRSHLFLTMSLDIFDQEVKASISGKIRLCDLAGSERPKKSGASGEVMKEAIEINKALTALGDVIESLKRGGTRGLIPYRNHKLTQLLSDSLGGNAKTLMFVNVSPARSDVEETLNSLAYASRARSISNDIRGPHVGYGVG